MAVKNKKRKSVLWHGWRRAELLSHLQSHTAPLSTSPPAVHVYCEAVSTGQSQQTQSAVSAAASVCDNSPSLHAQSYALITPYWTAMVLVSARPMLCLMCPTTTAPLHNHSVAVEGTLKMRDMKMREKDTALTYWTDLDSDCTPAG